MVSEKQQLIIQHKLKEREITSELIAVVQTGIINVRNFPGYGSLLTFAVKSCFLLPGVQTL